MPLRIISTCSIASTVPLSEAIGYGSRFVNRANHYFDCEAMQVAVATMLKLVGQESVKDAE